jgi:ferrous iron transport protein A
METNLPESLKNRLMGMGWLPGCEIKVVRKAPLGDPTIYLIDSTEISLRQDESKMISVKPLYPAPLSLVDKGIYRVVDIQGGKHFFDKLHSFSIELSAKIKVLGDSSKCRVHLRIDDKEFYIGKGMAQKILVEETNG